MIRPTIGRKRLQEISVDALAYGAKDNGEMGGGAASAILVAAGTPQGAWCPEPQRLEEGVFEALRRVHRLGGTSIALSALGTGEGRVKPALAAKLMLSGVKKFYEQYKDSTLAVTFSLPSERDFKAFSAELKRFGD